VNDQRLLDRGVLRWNFPAIENGKTVTVGRILPQRRAVAEGNETSRHSRTPGAGMYMREIAKQVLEYRRRRTLQLGEIEAGRGGGRSAREIIFVGHEDSRAVGFRQLSHPL